jgi:hypothetical protein
VRGPEGGSADQMGGRRVLADLVDQAAQQGYRPGVVGREIRLPEQFERLLDEARRDLPG